MRLFIGRKTTMKTKLNLLSFLLPLSEAVISEGGGGVGVTSPAPAAETAVAESPTAQTETSVESPASVTGTEETATQQVEVDPALEGLPTREELAAEAERKVPYAVGLQNVVKAYEALKTAHQPLKTRIEPWNPVLEKYQDPAEVTTNLELLDALSTPVLNGDQPVLDANQLPITDASPFISKLAATRPAQATALINAALDTQLVGEGGVRDTAFNWKLRDLGIDPSDIEGYKAWKQQGARVDAQISQLPIKRRVPYSALTH